MLQTRKEIFDDAITLYESWVIGLNKGEHFSCCSINKSGCGTQQQSRYRKQYNAAIVAAVDLVTKPSDEVSRCWPFQFIDENISWKQQIQLRLSCLKAMRDRHPERIVLAVRRAVKQGRS